MAHDVFISYGATDKAVAEAVCARLESAHRVRCWIAPRDIPVGIPWTRASIEALDKSAVMVSIFHGDEQASTPVDTMVERALRQGISVMPLRIASGEPTVTAADDAGVAAGSDTLPAPLKLRISRLGESVKALLDKGPAQTMVAVPAARAVAAATTVVMSRPGRESAPAPSKGGSSPWLIAAVVGAALVLAVAVGVYLGNQAVPLVSDAADAPTDASPADTSRPTAPALPDRALVPEGPPLLAEPPVLAPGERALLLEPLDVRPFAAVADPGLPQPHSATPHPETPALDRAAAEPPSGATAASNRTTATPPDAASAPRSAPAKPAEPVAAPPPAVLGTLFIDFVNSLPSGAVEVEVDGRVRWSEQLKLRRTGGVLTRLALQRVSEQLSSKLQVTPGDHRITVTVLTAEGEVRDYGTTFVHVEAARPATLRIRFSRFRNKLQIVSAAG